MKLGLRKVNKEEEAREAALQAIVDEGLIMPAARKGPTPAPRWRPVKVKGKLLSRTVVEDREDNA